ncbi:MAG: hypothetical protein C0506_14150 [Anaerolinea sp.]|nr:hypothetical protein [Anaerolinea sp.]
MAAGLGARTTLLALGAAVMALASSCSGKDGGATVNPGEEMGVEMAQRLTVTVANPARKSGWQTLGYVFDRAIIEDLRAGLSQDLKLQPRAKCPEQYRFWFGTDEWGSQIGYLCSGDVRIIRGPAEFWQGKDLAAPPEVAAALDAALAKVKANPVTSVNVSRSGGLAQSGRFEIRELRPDGTADLLVTVTDAALVRRLAATLDVSLPLVPYEDCEPRYRLLFYRGTPSFGNAAPPPGEIYAYRCRDGRDLLHGSQTYWVGDAAIAPAAFGREIDTILAGRGN